MSRQLRTAPGGTFEVEPLLRWAMKGFEGQQEAYAVCQVGAGGGLGVGEVDVDWTGNI